MVFSSNQKIKTALVLAVLSLFFGLLGLGLSYPRVLSPKSAHGEFRGIYPDGWIEDGAGIYLKDLLPRGNRLVIEFKERRIGDGPAHLKVDLCGKEIADFVVTGVGTKQVFFLTGRCNPRVISFHVLNPVVPSAADQRRLGAQVERIYLRSRVGLPLLAPMIVLQVTFLLFASSFVYWLATAGTISALGSYFIPVIGAYFLWSATYYGMAKILPLGLAALALSLGGFLASKINSDSRLSIELDGQINSSIRIPVLTAIILLAASLRFYGLTFGIPDNYHPDEVPKVNVISGMIARGDLNPRYFLHPSLLLYSGYFVHWCFDFIGFSIGGLRENILLAGRCVSALAGSVSVLLVYLIGRRVYSVFSGLIAAAVLSVLPLHVTCSRYMKEDALLVCMTLFTILFVLKSLDHRKSWNIFVAALFAGISASSKYSGVLNVIMVMSAPWLKSRCVLPDIDMLKKTLISMALVPVGFMLCTPYSFLTPNKFIKDFGMEKRHMLRGHSAMVDAWSQYWTFHFRRSVIPGASIVVTFVALVGIGIAIWRRRIEDLFILALILLFYLPAEWVKAKPAPQPERYILPCLPFLAIMAGEAFRRIASLVKQPIAATLLALILLAPLSKTVVLAGEIREDTRSKLKSWMLSNLQPKSRVYIDWKPYSPNFSEDQFSLTYAPRDDILAALQLTNLKRQGQDYLILSSLFYDRYFSQPATPAVRQIFRRIFQELPIVHEEVPRGETYGFHNPKLTLFSLRKEDIEKQEVQIKLKAEGKIEHTSNELTESYKRLSGPSN